MQLFCHLAHFERLLMSFEYNCRHGESIISLHPARFGLTEEILSTKEKIKLVMKVSTSIV